MRGQLNAVKTLLARAKADQGTDISNSPDINIPIPKTLIVVGHGQSNLASLIKALKKSNDSFTTSTNEDEIKESNLSEYQLFKIGDDNSPIVSHLFNNYKNADLGEWVTNEKLGLNYWHDVGENKELTIEDPLSYVRPPRNVDGWLQTTGLLVLSLSEGGKLLHSLQSHYNALVSLINPLMKASTTSKDRDKMRERCWNLFTGAKLNQWRIESGLASSVIINDKNILPIPLIVVVTGGHLKEHLREKQFSGQRDIIEAGLMKECAAIGASLISVDCGAEGIEEDRNLVNMDILKNVINMSFDDGKQIENTNKFLSPPILPACLNLPGLTDESLPWIPYNMISMKELEDNDDMKALMNKPFEIIVTFNETKKNSADVKRELPEELSCASLQEFIDTLSSHLAEDVDLETKADYHLVRHESGGAYKEGSKESKPDDLRAFFGDLINQKKKDTLAK